MIKFLCPSGHPLTAADNLGGKSGKCPRCHQSFVIPHAEEASADGTTMAMSGSALTPAMGSGSNLTGGGEIFVFLCPNGHKLNGPPSLKGKPGQCPHCGARFIIPTDEDIEEANRQAAEEDLDQPDDDQTAGGSARVQSAVDFPRGLMHGEDGYAGRPPAGAAGLGFIVSRLWERRTEDSELEIFLSEGEIIAPDHFAAELSTSDYGVFAVQESDGTFAVTVVPWNAVRRVGVRRMGELPGEMFGVE
jgi:hypothetical protein